MTQESGAMTSGWLLAPPGPGEVSIAVWVPETTAISPALRDALEVAARELELGDTQGFIVPFTPGLPATLGDFSGGGALLGCSPRWGCAPKKCEDFSKFTAPSSGS